MQKEKELENLNREIFITRLRRRGLTKEDAEDIVYDAVVKIIKYSLFDEKKDFNGLFWTTCWNLVINKVKKNKIRCVSLNVISEDDFLDEGKENFSFTDYIQDNEQKVILNDILSLLSDEEKKILQMLADGYEQKEIAEHFNISHSLIRLKIYNLRKVLRKDERLCQMIN